MGLQKEIDSIVKKIEAQSALYVAEANNQLHGSGATAAFQEAQIKYGQALEKVGKFINDNRKNMTESELRQMNVLYLKHKKMFDNPFITAREAVGTMLSAIDSAVRRKENPSKEDLLAHKDLMSRLETIAFGSTLSAQQVACDDCQRQLTSKSSAAEFEHYGDMRAQYEANRLSKLVVVESSTDDDNDTRIPTLADSVQERKQHLQAGNHSSTSTNSALRQRILAAEITSMTALQASETALKGEQLAYQIRVKLNDEFTNPAKLKMAYQNFEAFVAEVRTKMKPCTVDILSNGNNKILKISNGETVKVVKLALVDPYLELAGNDYHSNRARLESLPSVAKSHYAQLLRDPTEPPNIAPHQSGITDPKKAMQKWVNHAVDPLLIEITEFVDAPNLKQEFKTRVQEYPQDPNLLSAEAKLAHQEALVTRLEHTMKEMLIFGDNGFCYTDLQPGNILGLKGGVKFADMKSCAVSDGQTVGFVGNKFFPPTTYGGLESTPNRITARSFAGITTDLLTMAPPQAEGAMTEFKIKGGMLNESNVDTKLAKHKDHPMFAGPVGAQLFQFCSTLVKQGGPDNLPAMNAELKKVRGVLDKALDALVTSRVETNERISDLNQDIAKLRREKQQLQAQLDVTPVQKDGASTSATAVATSSNTPPKIEPNTPGK